MFFPPFDRIILNFKFKSQNSPKWPEENRVKDDAKLSPDKQKQESGGALEEQIALSEKDAMQIDTALLLVSSWPVSSST